ncbi:MAG: type II CRISPR RNA-guided endonuclease Cas9 [Fibrobacter sp.]|nr:type II CRISPR RNA-guided endonuclease Cas9 [Fibrobacter sp.]
MEKKRYRLGIDLGTASIGTALVELAGPSERPYPTNILHMGVRIFDDGRDPKTKVPLGVARREAKQARKMLDRYLRRRKRLTDALIEFKIWPKDKNKRKSFCLFNPYDIRTRALDEKVTLDELGRAIFHLNQRRGFKSNRKTDGGEDGKIRTAVAKLEQIFQSEGCRTLGEFYQKRLEKGQSIRARLEGAGAKAEYPFYPSRQMIEHEFDKIWEKQAEYYPETLTEAARTKIRSTLLYQRPLKPAKPGKCFLEPNENRAPIASPYFQRFRILQTINELRIIDRYGEKRPLSKEERDVLLEELSQKKELKFSAAKKLLNLKLYDRFSIQDEGRDKFQGDQIAALLGNKKYFGKNWKLLPIENQHEVVKALIEEQDTEKLIATLSIFGLSKEAAAQLSEETLPTGYGRLSIIALKKIIPYLEESVITYSEAAAKAGYNHSDNYTGEIFHYLPYYGKILENRVMRGSGNEADNDEDRYGKVGNPTVHIALNQLRRVVNCVIKHFGTPEQIVIEVARDLKMTQDEIKDYNRRLAENEKRNERIDKELEKLGQAINRDNRERYKLWEELADNPMERRCPYTGLAIGIEKLFTDEVEIEHILPFAQTYDNSLANKTLSMRYANRLKQNRSPYEAFAEHSYKGILSYQEMLDKLPQDKVWESKRWRFEKGALDKYNENGDFQARQLTDTAYASKLALEYLKFICPKDSVWAIPGRLTSMLRRQWGLNSILGREMPDGTFEKSRDHHGHHAIDGLVVAMTDRALLKKMSDATQTNWENQERILSHIDPPIVDIFDQAKERLSHLIVSHRKDHGLGGALHNDTAYGIVGEFKEGIVSTVHHKVPITSITGTTINQIQNEFIRESIQNLIANSSSDAALKDAINEYSNRTGIRRVSLTEKLSVVPIKDKTGRIYKAFKPDDNYCYDILANGTKWEGKIISRFEANTKGAKKSDNVLMRIIVGDTLCCEINEKKNYYLVLGITKGKITLAEPFEAGNLKERDRDKNDYFKYILKAPGKLKDLKTRIVHVDECGFVYDPGYKEK